MKKIKCKVCGKKFIIANWRIKTAKYCSKACYVEGSKSSKSYDKPRICVGCGKEFFATNWYQKFCNRACFCKTETKRKIIKCKNCGKEFMQVRLKQKFCCRKCSTPYKDIMLKKPKTVNLDNLWSKKVKIIAGNKCEYCEKIEGLNSHHIFSRSNKRVRWDLDNGICVCVFHHVFGLFSAHKSPIEFVEWLKEKRGIEWYNRLREKAKLTIDYRQLTKEDEAILREKLKV